MNTFTPPFSAIRGRISTVRFSPFLGDVLLTLFVILLGVIQLRGVRPFGPPRGPGGGPPGPFPPGGGGPPGLFDAGFPWLTVAFLVVCALPLLARRRYPLWSFLFVVALTLAYVASGNAWQPALAIVLAALYGAVANANLPRPAVLSITIGVCLVLGAILLLNDPRRPFTLWAIDIGWAAAAIMLGDALRSRRAYAREAELRAAEAERTKEESAQRQVAQARLEIARELHDVLAHSIALINVQASAGSYVIGTQPEKAAEAFENIKTVSHASLEELRSLVGVLRDPEGAAAPRAPVQRLEGLDQLIESVRGAGLPVETEIDDPLGEIPATIDLAAYRILQEALTNVVKHAGKATVEVKVNKHENCLSLLVTNTGGTNGAHLPAPKGGHGIIGMRERAAAVGGKVEAGPLPGGGFKVKASLPIREALS